MFLRFTSTCFTPGLTASSLPGVSAISLSEISSFAFVSFSGLLSKKGWNTFLDEFRSLS